MPFSIELILAILLNGGAAYGAYKKEAVTGDGAVAGLLVGSAIFVGAGVLGWVMLMWFFGSSSLISRLSTENKARAVRMQEKGSRRDWVQVAANGGLAAGAALAYEVTSHPAALVAVAAALAAATADTWASEIGSLSGHEPRSIVTFRTLPTGTSGGVTLLGTLASLAASLSVALIFLIAAPASLLGAAGSAAAAGPAAAAVSASGSAAATGPAAGALIDWLSSRPWSAAAIITFSGFLGSVVDSLLGATLQAQYEDSRGERTEKREGNRLVRGLPVVTNDVVNGVSGAVVTLAAVALV